MRILLLFLAAFTALAQIPGTFRVTGPVAPPATNSNFGATVPVYGTGGLLTGLSSLSQLQDLNRYPLARRHAGMKARLTNGAEYILDSTLTNWWNTGTANSIAELLTFEPGYGGTVNVLSYYGDNNGGGGPYSVTNTITGTNALGGRLVALGGATSWQLTDTVYKATQFGAVGDGVTDSTHYLTNWINFPAPRHELPLGTYIISAQIRATNSNLYIDWYGKTKAANGVNYHQIWLGQTPTYSNGRPIPPVQNVTINGHGVGAHDGNSLNAPEYFNGSGGALYGGHGFIPIGISNLVITGMTISNAPIFAIGLQGCIQTRLSNLYIDNGNGGNSTNFNGKNSDGIHWTDCQDNTLSDSFIRSADDNIAVTTLQANGTRTVISNVRGIHNAPPTSNGYFVRGNNLRLNREIGSTNIVGEVVVDGFVFEAEPGGNGGFTFQNDSATPSTQNIKISNGIWQNLTNYGTATYQARLFGGMKGCANVMFQNVTFTNIARNAYIQDSTNIVFDNCQFLDFKTNYWQTSTEPLLVDGANSTTIGQIVIQNSLFDGLDQPGLRFVGSISGSQRINGPIIVRGNTFRNGGRSLNATDGYAAVLVSGASSPVIVRDNVITQWRGWGVYALDCSDVDISNNYIDSASADSGSVYSILALYTAPNFSARTTIRNNTLLNASGSALFLRNSSQIDVSRNFVANFGRVTLLPGMTIRVLGDGVAPLTTTFSGAVTDNQIIGPGTGTGIEFLYTTTPAYTGRKITLVGNVISGVSTAIARDSDGYTFDSVYLEPIVIGATAPAGASGRNYLRWATTNPADATNTVLIERVFSGAGASSASPSGVLVITRNQGSGGNTGVVNGVSAISSHDQVDTASLVRGISSQARSTSTGTITVAQALAGQVVQSGGGYTATATSVAALPPSVTGGSTVGTAVGLNIQPQAGSGITNAFGINQTGASDVNFFAGPMQFNNTFRLGANGNTFTLARRGTAMLIGGLATVSDANVTANSLIYLTHKTSGGTPGWLVASNIVANTSFQIQSSSATDTSTVSWLLVEP